VFIIFKPQNDASCRGYRYVLYRAIISNLACVVIVVFSSSQNISRVIKSRRVRWAGHIAHMGHETCIQHFRRKTCRGKDHSEDLDIDGGLVSELILEK
jgi:hypothetical protein